MLELKAVPFYQAVSVLQHMSAAAEELLKHAPDEPMPEGIKSIIKVLVNDLLEATHALGARTAEKLTAQFRNNLDGNILYRTFVEAVTNIDLTLRVELGFVKLLVLDSSEAELYAPAEWHFGAEVRNKYPKATPDIDEAAKCLALGRSTATVFHLMRCLEIALKAISACLGLTPPSNPNWSAWLTPIRDERNKRGGTKWAENAFFQDVWQRLDSIKDAQRNSTMHIESIYTGDEARLIFDNTGAFMKKIASRMDEQGLPRA